MSDMGSGRLIMCLVGIWLAMGSVASAQPAVEWESVTEERPARSGGRRLDELSQGPTM